MNHFNRSNSSSANSWHIVFFKRRMTISCPSVFWKNGNLWDRKESIWRTSKFGEYLKLENVEIWRMSKSWEHTIMDNLDIDQTLNTINTPRTPPHGNSALLAHHPTRNQHCSHTTPREVNTPRTLLHEKSALLAHHPTRSQHSSQYVCTDGVIYPFPSCPRL